MADCNLSPKARQVLARMMRKDIDEVRGVLSAAKRDIQAFEREGDCIFALNIATLAEAVARLMYRAGEANGAIVLPDVYTREAAEAEGGK